MGEEKRKRKKPVRRMYAGRYILLTLVSFAVSVSSIRFFLEITGYPQIGSSELHIAHVLWGGLLLFAGALLPLIFINKRILDISAVFSGAGVGLFIDEVGKFITQANDYFYPAAAPIIYVLFLLTILVYNLVKKPAKGNLRTNLYHTLEDFEEVLEEDLSDLEKYRIIQRIERVDFPEDNHNLQDLQHTLVSYLKSQHPSITHEPDLFERWRNRLQKIENHLFALDNFHIWLRMAWLFLGIILIAQSIFILLFAGSPIRFSGIWRSILDSSLMLTGDISLIGLLRIILQVLSGLGLCFCAYLFKGNMGIKWARGALFIILGMLTVVNILVFYYDQFSTILLVVVEYIVFLLTNRFLYWQENS